jgi:hypothetical protein
MRWDRVESGPGRLPAAVYRGFPSALAGSLLSCYRRWRTFWGLYSLPGPQQRAVAGAGQTVSTRLLTRRAGVHVDFHAHRHFHNLRSFPTHQGFSQAVLARLRAGIKTRLASDIAQARKSRCRRHAGMSDAGNFPLGQGHFALGQGERAKAADRRMNNVGHGSRIRSACRSRLSETETSVVMSESRPKRRQSDIASVSRLSNPCLRSCCQPWRLQPVAQPSAHPASAAAYLAKTLQRLRSFDS